MNRHWEIDRQGGRGGWHFEGAGLHLHTVEAAYMVRIVVNLIVCQYSPGPVY